MDVVVAVVEGGVVEGADGLGEGCGEVEGGSAAEPVNR
jgi:hypothetical protein